MESIVKPRTQQAVRVWFAFCASIIAIMYHMSVSLYIIVEEEFHVIMQQRTQWHTMPMLVSHETRIQCTVPDWMRHV